MKGLGHETIYKVDKSFNPMKPIYLATIEEVSNLWHRRLGHTSMRLLDKLRTNELVEGLPQVKYEKTEVCDLCTRGKEVRSSFKLKDLVSISRPLELVHIDLCGLMRVQSLGGNIYILVVMDTIQGTYEHYSLV